jgi:dipeptidyl aminopeptidase/acylaminoacyl peptidase
MKRKLHVVDLEGKVLASVDHAAKLDMVRWSPDGARVAFLAGTDINDPSPGRLMVAKATGGKPSDALPGLEGDVSRFAWKDASTIVYTFDQGTRTGLAEVGVSGGKPRVRIAAGSGPALGLLALARDGRAAFAVDTAKHPRELFVLEAGGASKPERWTDSNPWTSEIDFAVQETIAWKARDGLRIEGVLIRPLEERKGTRYPLIHVVHGGPESHWQDAWLTSYSQPGQVAAAQGYAVLYANYRGSTGRGVEFSELDQADSAGDPTGKKAGEFYDLVDGIAYLVEQGLVDKSKVGVTGGSYGGYASAWCATVLTEHFAASVMFVGISDWVSKFGTTDIPNEMNLVHARKWPWDEWEWFRERSPLYYAKQARTPILILHGEADTRVHPSQSLELYRYLKTLGQVPVRLVLYPGEGHGNRQAAARYDYSLRMMGWMDHYLKGPGGEPPPAEVPLDTDKLGLKKKE